MSMSSYVVGFRLPDEKWQKMKAVYESCHDAGVETPEEVLVFFDWSSPDESGAETSLIDHECCKRYLADNHYGFEINLSLLPKNITMIRFYNSH